MKYIYESTQPGLFNFTIPGEDKTVHLFLGSKVTTTQKLTGGYLRVLKLVEEIDDEIVVDPIQPKAKIEDKIVKVEEIIEPTDVVKVTSTDSVVEVKDTVEPTDSIPKIRPLKKIKKL